MQPWHNVVQRVQSRILSGHKNMMAARTQSAKRVAREMQTLLKEEALYAKEVIEALVPIKISLDAEGCTLRVERVQEQETVEPVEPEQEEHQI